MPLPNLIALVIGVVVRVALVIYRARHPHIERRTLLLVLDLWASLFVIGTFWHLPVGGMEWIMELSDVGVFVLGVGATVTLTFVPNAIANFICSRRKAD